MCNGSSPFIRTIKNMNISNCKSLPELFLEKSEENSHKIQLVRKNKETGNDFIYSWAKTKKEVFAFSQTFFLSKT